jgi:hypothetical protein
MKTSTRPVDSVDGTPLIEGWRVAEKRQTWTLYDFAPAYHAALTAAGPRYASVAASHVLGE